MTEETQYKFIPVEKLLSRRKLRALTRVPPPVITKPLPGKYSLRKYVREVYDQGNIGSCTANAFCAAYRILEQDKSFVPSRLWMYFYERMLEDPEHKINNLTDSGADVIDGEYYIKHHGICSEKLWPYDMSKYNCEPPQICKDDAIKHKISSYGTINHNDIKKYIAYGTPVLAAIIVYESFYRPARGEIPIPDTGAENVLGGHEVCIIGYDNTTNNYEILNSWGPKWGDHGCCYIPYNYISNIDLCPELTIISI